MATDASIILGATPPPQNQLLDAYKAAAAIKGVQIEQGEQQYQIQQRNALRSILSQPDAVDPTTGKISKNALSAVLKVDPLTGQKLIGEQALADERTAQLAHVKSEDYAARQKILSEGAGSAVVAYDEALKEGKAPDAARAVAQEVYSDKRDSLMKSGMFSEDDMTRIPIDFDPIRTRASAMTLDQAIKQRESESRERQTVAFQTAELGLRKGDQDLRRQEAGTKGEQILTDPKTNTQYIFNPNAPAGSKFTTLDGEPYRPQGAQKMASGTPRSAMAEATKKYLEEHPDATSEDIIQFQAKAAGERAGETQLGKRGAQLSQAGAALDKLIDQSKDVYSKLPRGQFVPFNRLQKMVEEGTSSPDQAAAFAADQAVINQWAKAINPTGGLTVEATRKGADMLSNVTSAAAHDRVLEQMRKEIGAEKESIPAARSDIRESPDRGNASHPPLNLLKSGTITTFKNGQRWTVRNGQAVQVQ